MFVAFLGLATSIRPRPAVISHSSLKIPNNDNGFACNMCQGLVQSIEDYLKAGETEAAIEKLLDKACAALPAPYTSLCTSMVQLYLPTIIAWIDKEISAFDICTKIGLCQNGMPVRQPLKLPPQDNGVGCTICQEIVRAVDDFLDDGKTQEEIIEEVDLLCAKLPELYAPLCTQLVQQYMPAIIKWLEQEIEILDICTKLGLCKVSGIRPVRIPVNANNGIACDTCKQLVSYVETLLEEQKTQQEIIALAQQLCEQIPSPYGTICDALVAQYIPQIISWLEQEIEVFDVCRKLGLCTDAVRSPRVPIPAGANNGFACDTCKQLVAYVETLLEEKKTQEEIIALAQKLCDQIPAPYGTICDALVAQFIPQIISWLEQEIEVIDICNKLGLCTDVAIVARVPIPANAHNGFACDTCKQLVAYVETLLEEKKTQEEIIALAQQLCDKIPAPYGTICDALVAQFVPQIISWLEQEIEVIDICRKLGICTEAVKKARVPIPAGANNGFACDTCKQLVAYVETLLEEKKTQEEIIALAQKLCDQIPAPYGTICDALVAQFIPQIISWLEQEIEVIDICNKLGLCTEAIKKARVPIPAGANNGFACDTCKQLVAYVETLLEEKKTQEEIIALAQKLCDQIPAPYGTICDALVAQFIPQIISWLEQEIEVIDICNKLGLCTEAVKAPVHRNPRLPKLAARAAENGLGCTVCKKFVQWVEKEITDYSVPALWKLVSVDCQKIKYLAKFCSLITEQDIDTILGLILNKLPPAKVCEWIKIC